MEVCKKCPLHTHASHNGTHCELFDAYLIQNTYLFNLLKFDLNRKWNRDEVKDRRKEGSFFGPFIDPAESSYYFLSPKAPVEFDVESYEYQKSPNGVRKGYVFGLAIAKDNYDLSSETTRRKIHYRVLQNLGSELSTVNFSNWEKGEFTFEYSDGDICNKGERYSSRIKFVCNKSIFSISNIEIVDTGNGKFLNRELECMKEFVWETPYACSECRYNETMKYLVYLRIHYREIVRKCEEAFT